MANQDLTQQGFIHVHCRNCSDDDVWFRCNTCSKSDHFWRLDGRVHCACGASYDSGVCTCGEPVGMDGLRWVPFDEGPMALADLEWDYRRLAGIAAVLLLGVGAVAWWATS